MKKEIKNYLHLYLGCECWAYHSSFDNLRKLTVLDTSLLASVNGGSLSVKPILRKLSDMTEEEKIEVAEIMGIECLYNLDTPVYEPVEFLYLLSKHFDLFGLVEAGLAIDKTTLK